MARDKRKFSPQFKAEAVQFVFETGRPIAEIARELEINEGTLGNWVKLWKQANAEPEKALTPLERARVAEMEAEIRRLRMENEFLKKAAVDSTHQRNSAVSLSAGVSQPRTLRGRLLSFAAITSRSACVRSLMLTPLGRYCRSSRLVFSLVPRCQGL